eukprot:1039691-Amphidinium_carterae.1
MIQVEVKVDEHEEAQKLATNSPSYDAPHARVTRRPQSTPKGMIRRSAGDAAPGSYVAAPPAAAPSDKRGNLPGAVVELAQDLQRLTAQLKQELRAHSLAAKQRHSAFQEALQQPVPNWATPEPEPCLPIEKDGQQEKT